MTNDEKITPTDGEMRILKAIFANMNSKPDVDWDAAASAASLGNAKSIKERYRQMTVRLGWNSKSGGGGDGNSAPSTPKNVKASPSKVVKRSGGRKKKAIAEDEDEELDEKPVAAVKEEFDDGEF